MAARSGCWRSSLRLQVLAHLLSLDDSLSSGRKISKQTVAGTITAPRDLAATLPPPGVDRFDLDRVFAEGRRAISETRGLRLELSPGVRHEPTARRILTPAEITELIKVLRAMSAPLSGVCADVSAVLYLTGERVGAVLALAAGDLRWTPDGRCWIYTHAKARPDDRPVLVRTDRRELSDMWRRLGPESPLWTDGSRLLTYGVFVRRLDAAASLTGLPRVRPHDLRRAFATHVAALLGLSGMATAGGWLSESIAESYVGKPPLHRGV